MVVLDSIVNIRIYIRSAMLVAQPSTLTYRTFSSSSRDQAPLRHCQLRRARRAGLRSRAHRSSSQAVGAVTLRYTALESYCRLCDALRRTLPDQVSFPSPYESRSLRRPGSFRSPCSVEKSNVDVLHYTKVLCIYGVVKCGCTML